MGTFARSPKVIIVYSWGPLLVGKKNSLAKVPKDYYSTLLGTFAVESRDLNELVTSVGECGVLGEVGDSPNLRIHR